MTHKGSRHRLGLTQKEYADKLARIFEQNEQQAEDEQADTQPPKTREGSS